MNELWLDVWDELLCWGKQERVILTVSTSKYMFSLLYAQAHTYVIYKTYTESWACPKEGKNLN